MIQRNFKPSEYSVYNRNIETQETYQISCFKHKKDWDFLNKEAIAWWISVNNKHLEAYPFYINDYVRKPRKKYRDL